MEAGIAQSALLPVAFTARGDAAFAEGNAVLVRFDRLSPVSGTSWPATAPWRL
jgi:hypothetical protein